MLSNFFPEGNWRYTYYKMLHRQQFYLNFTLHCLTSLAHYAPWWAIGSVREQCIIPTSSADWASYHSECKDLLWVRWGDLDYDF